MYRISIIVTACLLGTAASAAESTIKLEDWRQVGAPVWEFADGVATAGPLADGQADASFLVSTSSYDNFRLRIEFWVDDDTNSGIMLRCGEINELSDITPDRCYEVNIWDNHPNQDFRTGSIVTLAKPAAKVDTLGRWNRFDIIASGSTISVSLNGVQTAVLENDRSASGLIALQYAGKHGLKFRRLEIDVAGDGQDPAATEADTTTP
jgi:hypothetical protein